jgi:MFS family permease
MQDGTPVTKIKLSVMMFLQYAIWGAWLPILWPYLSTHRGFDNDQIGWMFAVGAAGALLAPFVAGQIADRYFNTEKFLAISHLIGALLVWQLATIESFTSFLVFSLVYSIVYSPTLPLTNSLAFHHLPDRDRDFGRVRVWGTVGWIVVGIGIGHLLLNRWTPDAEMPAKGITAVQLVSQPETFVPKALKANHVLQDVLDVDFVAAQKKAAITDLLKKRELEVPKGADGTMDLAAATAALALTDAELLEAQAETLGAKLIGGVQAKGMRDAFRMSALLGFLMGLFCLLLPKTPPARNEDENATVEAMGEIKASPALRHLFFISLIVSCIHQFYFVHTAGFLGEMQRQGAGEGLSSFFDSIFGVGGGGLMTIGQITEIAVLALIPLLAKKFSRKSFLLVGLAAYALRMALFTYVHVLPLPEILTLVLGVALHGLCFGCFIFVAFMIVDEETSADVRASAQSLYNLVVIGIGIIVGSKVANWIANLAQGEDAALDYALPEHTSVLFGWPMWAAVACFIYVFALYPKSAPPAAKAA